MNRIGPTYYLDAAHKEFHIVNCTWKANINQSNGWNGTRRRNGYKRLSVYKRQSSVE